MFLIRSVKFSVRLTTGSPDSLLSPRPLLPVQVVAQVAAEDHGDVVELEPLCRVDAADLVEPARTVRPQVRLRNPVSETRGLGPKGSEAGGD